MISGNIIIEASGFAAAVAMAYTGDGTVLPVTAHFDGPDPLVRIAVVDAYAAPATSTDPKAAAAKAASVLATIEDIPTALHEANRIDHPVSVGWADLRAGGRLPSVGRVGSAQVGVVSEEILVAYSNWDPVDPFLWLSEGIRPWSEETAPLGVAPLVKPSYAVDGEVPDEGRVIVGSRSANLEQATGTDIGTWATRLAEVGTPFALLTVDPLD